LPFFFQRSTPDAGASEEFRLVQAARRADRAAFDALVHAHQDRLRAFLARRVGSEAAEDVLQETFLAAWQAIPRLDLKVRFKTWLFSIAVHKAADHFRASGRRADVETPLDPERLPSVPAAGDDYREAEQRAAVRQLLERLSDDQRQILEMYYFAELNLPEIATVLGRNLNTLKYQFYRAHAVAAQQMEYLEGFPARGEGADDRTRPRGEVTGKKKVVQQG
jgi:RNA polymerase sigma-70 factor, ECF subfamily